MKTRNSNLLIALVATIFLGFSACSTKDNNPTPASPTMKDMTITGSGTSFTATVNFSEAVYAKNDKSGNLTNESFIITITGGTATIINYTVQNTAGTNTATVSVSMSVTPTSGESLKIEPASTTSIYNATGQAMRADESINTVFTSNDIIISDDGSGTGTTTWTADNTYILNGLVFVNEGQILTIEAGTVIKGRAGQGENASALIVARGGKIMAQGTADAPIIFTAEADDLVGSVSDLDDGLWGGVILLGKATINTVPNEQQIEGITQTEPRGLYGGTNDDDNSGVLRYISIRHGGTDIGAGNEINGLTLGGVGNQTVIDYIEVISNKDDGIEFFGGDPNVSHFIVAFCGDDCFDYDQGYHGNGQFWVGIQGYDRGDRLGEHDGGTNPETGQPYAIPYIYNATYCGRGAGAGRRTLTFRDNAGGHYANSIFYNQDKGVDIELLAGECSYNRFQSQQLTIENNIFYSIVGDPIFKVAADGVNADEEAAANLVVNAYFTDASNEVYNPGFNVTANIFNIIPTNDVTANMATIPTNAFFTDVNYKGAFEPGNNWAQGWTLISKYMGN